MDLGAGRPDAAGYDSGATPWRPGMGRTWAPVNSLVQGVSGLMAELGQIGGWLWPRSGRKKRFLCKWQGRSEVALGPVARTGSCKEQQARADPGTQASSRAPGKGQQLIRDQPGGPQHVSIMANQLGTDFDGGVALAETPTITEEGGARDRKWQNRGGKILYAQ